jgi:hypothetical protein
MPLEAQSSKLRRQVVGGVSEVYGEVAHVVNGGSDLQYVVILGVGVSLLLLFWAFFFLFYFIVLF